MPAQSYVVCEGRSCLMPNDSLIRAGQEVPVDKLSADTVKTWEKSGFIRRRGAEPLPAAPVATVTADGKLKQNKQVIVKGKFNRNPSELDGRPLSELNAMLVDLNSEPADTVEEAIGLLSADYNA